MHACLLAMLRELLMVHDVHMCMITFYTLYCVHRCDRMCVQGCDHVCAHMCVYVYMYLNDHVCVHMFGHARVHFACIGVYIFVYLHISVYDRVCTYRYA